MDELTEYIVKILTECRDEIRARIADEKINATGKTSEGLQVEVYDGGVRLVETDGAPIESLEIGHAPGYVSVADLVEWATAKFGISENEAIGLAFAVQHKIMLEGTDRFKNPRNDIYSPAVNKAVEEIDKTIGIVIERVIETNL